MKWGFFNSLAFAAIMTMKEMEEEKKFRLFKTQKYYQECYEKIADDGKKAFEVMTNVAQKASRCYIPQELLTGSKYLPLYCFSLVIRKQGKITNEQNKILKLFFDNMDYPFSLDNFLYCAKAGRNISDFNKIINISKTFVGDYWKHYFRALYKSGTQKDLQDLIDCSTSMIFGFSVLGNPNSTIAKEICSEFIDAVNYQINEVREITLKEIDWLCIIPIPERLKEMKKYYEILIDSSNITEAVSKDELLPLLEMLILNSIYDIVMLTKQPESIKMKMIDEAIALTCIEPEISAEEYIKHIRNNTQLGSYYKSMLSSYHPLGMFWKMIAVMSGQTDKLDEGIALPIDLLSILIHVENYFADKYNFLGKEHIAKNYVNHILEQLSIICEEC